MARASVDGRPNQRLQAGRDLPARNPSLRSFEVMRELQSIKIKKVRDALVATGYRRLDAQARVLGLPRSTTWSILQAKHKRIGLSAGVIKQILGQTSLPLVIRSSILEYVNEKSKGTYGHTSKQRRRFAAALERECLSPTGEQIS